MVKKGLLAKIGFNAHDDSDVILGELWVLFFDPHSTHASLIVYH